MRPAWSSCMAVIGSAIRATCSPCSSKASPAWLVRRHSRLFAGARVFLTDIVAEIPSALDWLAAHGASYGVAGPVVLSGWSAGAHLVAMALTIRTSMPDWRCRASTISRRSAYRPHNALKLTDTEIAKLSPLRLPVAHKRLDIAMAQRASGARARFNQFP